MNRYLTHFLSYRLATFRNQFPSLIYLQNRRWVFFSRFWCPVGGLRCILEWIQMLSVPTYPTYLWPWWRLVNGRRFMYLGVFNFWSKFEYRNKDQYPPRGLLYRSSYWFLHWLWKIFHRNPIEIVGELIRARLARVFKFQTQSLSSIIGRRPRSLSYPYTLGCVFAVYV